MQCKWKAWSLCKVPFNTSAFEVCPLTAYDFNSLLEIAPMSLHHLQERIKTLSAEIHDFSICGTFPLSLSSSVSAQKTPTHIFHAVSRLCWALDNLCAFVQAISSKGKAPVSVLMIRESPVPQVSLQGPSTLWSLFPLLSWRTSVYAPQARRLF